MKYSVKFYPEKRKGVTENLPINLSVVFNKQRMFYYTGKRCHADQWETSAKDKLGNKTPRLKKNQIPINGQNAQEFMADLDRIKIAVDDLFKIYDVRKEFPTPEELREDLKIKLGKKLKNPEIESIWGQLEIYKDRVGLGLGTSQNIGFFIEHLKKFDSDASFEKLDGQYLDYFLGHMIEKQGLCKNTASSQLIIFNGFLKYCLKNKKINYNPFVDHKIEPLVFGDPVYLSIEERDLIFNAEIENKQQSLIRDMFVLQCFIGCRFGDLLKLRKSNIIDNCIEYIGGKTKDKKLIVARVPLSEKAKKIIDKYNLSDGRLVPYYKSTSMYNKGIKELLEELKITRLVTIPDKKTRESKQVRICEIASSHMARRVFIGGLIKKGALIPVIASMSGHSKNSQAFNRYFSIDTDDRKTAMNLIE